MITIESLPGSVGRLDLSSLFPAGVAAAACEIDPDARGLFAQEEDAVRRAAPARRAEFAAGRVLARRLLARTGAAPCALPRKPDRRPEWPESIVGSIAHARDVCVAAVARSSEFAAIGIDVEPAEPVEEELWPSICTARELRWLAGQPEHLRGRLVKSMFSAKESAYKCVSTVLRADPGFTDLETRLDLAGMSFVVTSRSGFRPGFVVSGRLHDTGRWIITGVAMPRGASKIS